jgi:hypothetical protein
MAVKLRRETEVRGESVYTIEQKPELMWRFLGVVVTKVRIDLPKKGEFFYIADRFKLNVLEELRPRELFR